MKLTEVASLGLQRLSCNKNHGVMVLDSFLLYTFLVKSKNPFKILADAEPRLWRGEAKNSSCMVWRCVLVKIRTFFQENPDADF